MPYPFDLFADSVLELTIPDATATKSIRSGGALRIGDMLLIIAILLILLWGGGFAFHVAGGLIHLLLVVALILFILHLVSGRGV